jgi:hypothetical protein
MRLRQAAECGNHEPITYRVRGGDGEQCVGAKELTATGAGYPFLDRTIGTTRALQSRARDETRARTVCRALLLTNWRPQAKRELA